MGSATTPASLEALRERLRGYLEFIRPKILHIQMDGEKIVQFRRISDLRIKQLAVRKSDMNAVDVNQAISPDPKKKKFVAMAIEEKLIRPEHAALSMGPTSQELGYLSELCILSEILPKDKFQLVIRAFTRANPMGAAVDKEEEGKEEPAPLPSDLEIPEKVQKLLGNVKDLWSIPASTEKLTKMLAIPDTRVEHVAEEIERDPGLSTQVLRVVNSAFYGLAGKIASIKRAVVMLGFQTTKRIVTLASLVSKLGKEHAEVKFDLKSFWGHSLVVAYSAQGVAKESKLGAPDDHFSAGLLHDIGKLVEYQYLRHAMRQIISGVAGGAKYEEVEERVLGVNHAVIGAAVCAKWGFPPSVVDSIKHHLDPVESLEEMEITREAFVVAGVCSMSKHSPTPAEMEKWCALLRLEEAQIDRIRSEASHTSISSLRDVFMYA